MILHTTTGAVQNPPWLGNQNLHISHQSNLIRKDVAFYGQKFPGIVNNLPYVWPI